MIRSKAYLVNRGIGLVWSLFTTVFIYYKQTVCEENRRNVALFG